jgi:hypothetical protein
LYAGRLPLSRVKPYFFEAESRDRITDGKGIPGGSLIA